MKAHAVIFLGAPGAGKGTQAREAAHQFGVPHISTGDMLRAAMKSGSALPAAVRTRMAAGELVTDEVVCALVEERTGHPDCARGYILDGFPRTLAQADFVDRLLAGRGQGKPLVVNLEIRRDLLMKRLTGRRTCPVCGRIYNLYLSPPRRDEVCDVDGSFLLQRADDQEAAIRQRLAAYEEQTKPLVDYYRARNLLHDVDGNGQRAAISEEIQRLLKAA